MDVHYTDTRQHTLIVTELTATAACYQQEHKDCHHHAAPQSQLVLEVIVSTT